MPHDKASGLFADPGKVRRLDFHGEHFACEGRFTRAAFAAGPARSSRRPAVRPLASAFAGQHAELIFALRHSTAGMRDYVARVETATGSRRPLGGSVKVLWGILPIVAPTEEEALRRPGRDYSQCPR